MTDGEHLSDPAAHARGRTAVSAKGVNAGGILPKWRNR